MSAHGPAADSLSILVVDDDANSREGLSMLLADVGHRVDDCGNARRALARLDAGRYDVLLTDHLMPGMSGLELVVAARATSPGLRCFIMSGHPAPDAASDVVWINKPIDIDALLAVLSA